MTHYGVPTAILSVPPITLSENNTLEVIFDDVKYNNLNLHSFTYGSNTALYAGNPYVARVIYGDFSGSEDTGEPFCIVFDGSSSYYLHQNASSTDVEHTASINIMGEKDIKTLDSKFLPNNIESLETTSKDLVGAINEIYNGAGSNLTDTLPIGAEVLINADAEVPAGWEVVDETYDANEVYLSDGRTVETAMNELIDLLYPVGSVITNGQASFDPNILYAGTTWERIKGKVIVGVDEDDTDFAAVNNTGGAKTHTLTIDEMPRHGHDILFESSKLAAGTDYSRVGGSTTSSGVVKKEGQGVAHNNLQPYITKYVWERTA